jgi:ribonuclease HII
MVGMHEEHPRYHWAGNKGYSSPEHVAALSEHGPCELHRRSWRLPGVGGTAVAEGGGDPLATAPAAAGGWSPEEAGDGWSTSPDEDADGWATSPDEDADGWATTGGGAAPAGAGVLVGGA